MHADAQSVPNSAKNCESRQKKDCKILDEVQDILGQAARETLEVICRSQY